MKLVGAVFSAAGDVERILRSLPDWFGIEESRQHFAHAWEVHCMAVQAIERGKGIGRALHAHVEAWLIDAGARFV